MSQFKKPKKQIEISPERLEKALIENDAVIYEGEERPAPVYKKITFPVPSDKRNKFSDYIEKLKDSLEFIWVAVSPEDMQKARSAASEFADIYKGWLATAEEPGRPVLASLGYDGELASFVYDDNDKKARNFALCLAVAANAYEDIADTDDIRRWPKKSQQEAMFLEKHGKSSREFCLEESLSDLCDIVRLTVEVFGNIDTYGWQRLRRRAKNSTFLESYHGMKTPDDLECAVIFEKLDKLEREIIPTIIRNSTTEASDPKMRKIDATKLTDKRIESIMQSASADTATFDRRKGDVEHAKRMYDDALHIKKIWEGMDELTEKERNQAIVNINVLGGNPQFLPERVRAVALIKDVDMKLTALREGISAIAI